MQTDKFENMYESKMRKNMYTQNPKSNFRHTKRD